MRKKHSNAGSKSIGLLPAFLIVCTVIFSCAEEPVKKDNPPGLQMEYRQEGFTSRDTYRIIIINPRDEEISDINSVAKRRALTSMQNYLKGRDSRIGKNTNAALLNLINEYGSLKKENMSGEKRDIYIFEVRKPNLKEYLEDIR